MKKITKFSWFLFAFIAVCFIIFGNFNSPVLVSAEENGTWSTGTSGGTARTGHTSVFYNGKIYSWGGNPGYGDNINTMDIYDINSDSWSTGASGGTARTGHASVIYNGKIYSWGGRVGLHALNTMDIYDINSDSWSTGTSGGTARTGHTSVLYNGKIYSLGGSGAGGNYWDSALNTVDIYDIATGVWSTGTSGDTFNWGHTSVVYNGKIYSNGGGISIYDIASGLWSSGAMSTPSHRHTSVLYNGKIYSWGGVAVTNNKKNTMDIYDIATDSWSLGTTGGTGREQHSSVVYNGKIYSWGGQSLSGILNTIDIYDIESSQLALPAINMGTEKFADFLIAGITNAIEVNKSAYDTAIATAKATKGSDLTLAEVQTQVDEVNAAQSLKAIASFNLVSPAISGVINETAHTIVITVPYGTNVTALVPTIATSIGASVSPASGVAQNFTSPVTYTVTAADTSAQTYIVTITVYAGMDVSGNISTDTTWTLANSPYIVTNTVQVLEGVKLTIEPGVMVKFNSATGLNIGGELIASGTVDSIITFTSNQSTPKAGDWNNIKFFDTAISAIFDSNHNYISGSIIRYAKVAYAGGLMSSPIALNGGNISLFIDNNIIELNKWGAIFVNKSQSKITNNIVRNNSIGTSKGDCGNAVIQINKDDHYIENNIIDNNSLAGITLNNSNNSHILNNEITNNGCGISFYGSNNEIKNNLIDNNSSMGVYYYSGSLSGAGNIIKNNSIKNNGNAGIYFYKYNNSISKAEIISNNIYNNFKYNFWLDDSSANIDVINNYWGTTDNASIANKIYDYFDLISLGKVFYEPYATAEIDPDDQTAPTLVQITPVITPTNDNTPNYIFNSNEAGTITYGGLCSSLTTSANTGNNTITFNTLADGTYNNCTIKVTDIMSNESSLLNVSAFTVDTTAPIAIVSGRTQGELLIVTWEIHNNPWSNLDGVQVNAKIDGSSFWLGSYHTVTQNPYTVSYGYNLSIGLHTIETVLTDQLGNIATSTQILSKADNIAPVIILLGENPVNIYVGDNYTDAGASASDNIDGNITANIVIINPVNINAVGAYTITYNISDAAGNSATQITRTVNVIVNPDIAAAQAVIDQISALPTPINLVLGDATAVTNARATYTALTETQKSLVTNLAVLTATETQMTSLTTTTAKVTELETAIAKDLTIEANLTSAESAVTAAYSTFESVIAGGAKTDLVNRFNAASGNVSAAALKADEISLVDDVIKGENVDLSHVTTFLTNPLPTRGLHNSGISWTSSNPAAISDDGQAINRPAFADGDTPVALTATISKGILIVCNISGGSGGSGGGSGGGCGAAVGITKVFALTILKLPASMVASITSATYTVSAGGTVAETITNISFGTTRDTFLAALVKGHTGQTWIDTGLSNPVVTGNTLVVTAQDGTTVVTYTLAVALNPAKSITSFNFASPNVMGVINETAHTITITVPYGTDATSITPTVAISTGATISPASGVAQDFTNPVTYTVTAADTTTQTYIVTVNMVTATQTVPTTDGVATANSTTPQVVISSPAQAVTVTVSSGTTNASINYGSLISGGTGIIPQTTIDTTSADIAISASTVVTSASTTWDGVIAAPTITTVTLPETSGQTTTLSTAIEIGFTGAKLSFDKAVRILLPGQAGKKAGYIRAGITFTEITNICSADNQATGDALVTDGDCKIDAGSDLVIWTKHFTSFATYTQTAIPTPTPTPTNTGGGGGGGGGAPTPTDTSAPTSVSIVINNGAATTTSKTVTLTLSASDASTIFMMISNDSSFSGVVWENYSTTKSWLLTGGNGIKTVYVKFKDAYSNTSGVVNNSISLNFSGVIAEQNLEPQVLGVKITDTFNEFILAQKNLVKKIDKALTQRMAGKILLQVQDHGEAWYVDSVSQNRFYLADGAKAYGALRKFGLGITNKDLAKIPVGIEKRFLDVDTDADGLADKLEEGLGTDKNKKDTDGDGVSDYDEVVKNQTNPLGAGKLIYDNKLLGRLKGRIVLQIEGRGEAWYINPADGKRYYMKDGGAAYQIMRFLSLGITNENIRKINIGD